MKYYELTDEEKKILKDVEAGKYKRVKNFRKVISEMREAARNTLNKNRNINIRITERTLHGLRRKAVEEGIPYQTLAASVLHKYVSV